MVADTNQSAGVVRSRTNFSTWFAIEVAAVVVVVFLAIIAVAHIAQTSWAGAFLYNGDSLALPLIQQSIVRGEPLHWVFSSQDYLFPEGPIYAIGAIFSNSARVAMYVNACLNVIALYGLLRAVAHLLARGSRHALVEITIAISSTGLFVIFVLLEPTPAINAQGIATLFLFSTYYDGVILSGLAVVALTLWVTRAFGPAPWERNRTIKYVIYVSVLTGLTSFSDPLYFLQVIIPLACAAVVLIFMNRISWHDFLILAVPTAFGSLVAIVMRIVFGRSFAASPGSYLSFQGIPGSIHILVSSLRALVHSPDGLLTIFFLGLTLAINAAIFVFALYAQSRPELATRIATSEVFVVAFVNVSVASLLLGMILTGSPTTRYLLPIYVFPLLTVVSVGIYVLRRLLIGVELAEFRRSLSRFALSAAAIAAALVIIVGAMDIAPIARSASGADYTGANCFEKFTGTSHINGVGSYWTVRPLALYGTSKGSLLQADDSYGSLEAYAWINNLGSYQGKRFSYVISDSSGEISPNGLSSLGKPRQVISCPGYQIYDYRGTEGEKLLTDLIQTSVKRQLARRRGL